MAAGLGYIEFTTGDVLTAAQANGYLASQTVMVFADAAARTAAIASPQEGMISYLKDTNSTEYYSGSAWVAIGGSASTFVGCAAYRSSGTQAVANITYVILTLPSEEYDTDGFHSTSTNTSRMTIPTGKGGKYRITAGWGTITNAGTLQQIVIYVNGSQYVTNGYAGGVFADQRGASDQVWGYSGVLTLAAGDYFEIAAYHNNGSSVDIRNVRLTIDYLGA